MLYYGIDPPSAMLGTLRTCKDGKILFVHQNTATTRPLTSCTKAGSAA